MTVRERHRARRPVAAAVGRAPGALGLDARARGGPALDPPDATRVSVEVEAVDVEAADVRLVAMVFHRRAGRVDLHIAVVPARVGRGRRGQRERVEEQAREDREKRRCLAHLCCLQCLSRPVTGRVQGLGEAGACPQGPRRRNAKSPSRCPLRNSERATRTRLRSRHLAVGGSSRAGRSALYLPVGRLHRKCLLTHQGAIGEPRIGAARRAPHASASSKRPTDCGASAGSTGPRSRTSPATPR